MSNAAILLGGGNSSRMRGAVEDKIVAFILNKPVFAYSIEAFIESKAVDTLVIVYKNLTQKEIIEQWMLNSITHDLKIIWCQGGDRRQDSVIAGLKKLPDITEYIFIHDMARPLIKSSTIKELHNVLLTNQSVTLARRIVDSVKQITSDAPLKLNSIDRSTLWATETPQAFPYEVALEALAKIEIQGLEITDDTTAVSMLGYSIEIVENQLPNPKITVKSDMDYIHFLLTQRDNYAII